MISDKQEIAGVVVEFKEDAHIATDTAFVQPGAQPTNSNAAVNMGPSECFPEYCDCVKNTLPLLL
ncbi:MAG: hypothetical protein JWM35_2539 [Verrucomicrobia bacterium]|nr:hypothetical protein [Verrucomicrobiota bacterium]